MKSLQISRLKRISHAEIEKEELLHVEFIDDEHISFFIYCFNSPIVELLSPKWVLFHIALTITATISSRIPLYMFLRRSAALNFHLITCLYVIILQN